MLFMEADSGTEVALFNLAKSFAIRASELVETWKGEWGSPTRSWAGLDTVWACYRGPWQARREVIWGGYGSGDVS
jgi:hypothetical protein